MLSQDDSEVGLYFVIPSELKTKDECEPIMLEIFKECEKQTLDPNWITETKCLALQPDKLNVFVFQRFEGKAFEHLSQFKCVLVGPQCLVAIFKEQSQLPHLSRPFFTMAMNGLIVAASGFGPEGKKRLKEKIELMAGMYVPQLKACTTHLIVNSVQSEKYFKAVKNSIPIMTEEWVDAVYSASLQGYVKATDPKFARFKCLPFKGLKISTSKLSASAKKKIVELIESNGGIHDGSLSNDMHMLVVSKPDGEKFKHARQWNLACVIPKYVTDCVRHGHALPLEGYLLEGKVTSSPKSEQRRSEDLDFSTISNIAPPERSRINETAFSDLTTTSLADLTTASFFKTPRQPRSGYVKSTLQPINAQSFFYDPASSGESVFVRPQPPSIPSPNRAAPTDPSSRRNLTPKKKTPSPAQFKNLLDELDLSKTKEAGQFLDGCKVFLHGFNTEHEEKLRRVLKGSGASRFTELSDSVTHILVGNVFDKAFSKQLKELSYRPHIVTLEWLLQSISLRRGANEEEYSYAEAEAKNLAPETPSPLSKKGLALLQRGDESPVAASENVTRTVDSAVLSSKKSSRYLKELREQEPEVEDLTAFYRQETSTSISALPPPAHSVSETALPDDSKDCSTICSQDYVQIFVGLKFALVGLTEDVADAMCKTVVQNGGQIVPRTFKGVPDYAVVPLTGAPVSAAGEIVTPYWVEDCICHSGIVPVEYYHQPFSVQAGKAPLRGCVIGVSGYVRKERLFLSDITFILGGIAQEVFARKDNPEKNAKASTHLVCNAAEGNKFHAAVKWKLPVVSNLWLLDCCKSGQRSSVRPFLIDPKQEIEEKFPTEEEEKEEEEKEEKAVTEVQSNKNVGESQEPVTPLRPLALQRIAGETAALSPFHVTTPNTPYGISEKPSPGERKRIKKWINDFPDYPVDSEPSKRRLSTPLSEIKRKVWTKIGVTTPGTALEDKPVCKRSYDGREETLSQSAKRARLDEVGGKQEGVDTPSGKQQGVDTPSGKQQGVDTPSGKQQGVDTPSGKQQGVDTPSGKQQGVDTPSGNEKSSVPKTLFPENISRAEGQLEEAKKLLQMPLSTSGINAVSSNGSNLSPMKEKIVPRVPKEVSQPYEINWEDPVTVAEAKNDSHCEDRQSSSTSSSKRKSVETEEEIPHKKASVRDKPGRSSNDRSDETHLPLNRVFMLSNVENRERFANMVEKLGGKVIASPNFESVITHLVVDKPARNEKLLASIASGKWVLHVSYIEDSFKAGIFLQEAEYEWGAPENEKLISLLRPTGYEVQLAKAAYRWRQKLSATGVGAFEGIRAVVGAVSSRIDSFRRLIKAGGGIVLEPTELEQATHYFLDQSTKSAQTLDNPANVPVYPLIFLSEFLMKGPQ